MITLAEKWAACVWHLIKQLHYMRWQAWESETLRVVKLKADKLFLQQVFFIMQWQISHAVNFNKEGFRNWRLLEIFPDVRQVFTTRAVGTCEWWLLELLERLGCSPMNLMQQKSSRLRAEWVWSRLYYCSPSPCLMQAACNGFCLASPFLQSLY